MLNTLLFILTLQVLLSTLNVDCAVVFRMSMRFITKCHVMYIFCICLIPDVGPTEAETCRGL